MSDEPGELPSPEERRCPLEPADEKYEEAHFFIHEMMRKYHDPYPFRWCLNAFLSALRSVIWQTEAHMKRYCRANAIDGFDEWLEQEKGSLHDEGQIVKRFLDGRDLVIHHGQLTHKSKVFAGLFRGRDIKLGFNDMEIDPGIPSEVLIERLNNLPEGGFAVPNRGDIGEQHGVKRHWKAEELCEGDEDVLEAAHSAWLRVGEFLTRAHEFLGIATEERPGEPSAAHSPDRVNILLETDLDPTLFEKWGWT